MRALLGLTLAAAALPACRAGGHNFHVEHDGRQWQWTELVRALDGYITVVDRGRHSRFWNFMAAWYQSPGAAAVVGGVDETLPMQDDMEEDMEDAAATLAGAAATAAVAAAGAFAAAHRRRTPSTLLVGDWVALWHMGKSQDQPGELAVGWVHDFYGPGRRHGYVHLDSSADAAHSCGIRQGPCLGFLVLMCT